jgi:hypothetical protein
MYCDGPLSSYHNSNPLDTIVVLLEPDLYGSGTYFVLENGKLYIQPIQKHWVIFFLKELSTWFLCMHVRRATSLVQRAPILNKALDKEDLDLRLHPLPPTHPLWLCLVSWAHCCMAATLNLINSQDAFLYSFFVGLNWSGELYSSPFPNRLSNLPFNCHTPLTYVSL